MISTWSVHGCAQAVTCGVEDIRNLCNNCALLMTNLWHAFVVYELHGIYHQELTAQVMHYLRFPLLRKLPVMTNQHYFPSESCPIKCVQSVCNPSKSCPIKYALINIVFWASHLNQIWPGLLAGGSDGSTKGNAAVSHCDVIWQVMAQHSQRVHAYRGRQLSLRSTPPHYQC